MTRATRSRSSGARRDLGAVGETLERDHELDAIAAALDAAGRGDGHSLVLEGPAGIGKSRLLDDARALAKVRGFGVLRAAGEELERAMSLLDTVPRAEHAERAGEAGQAYVKHLEYHNIAADQTYRSYLTISLPAGKYMLTAKLATGNDHDDMGIDCRVRLGGTELDRVAEHIPESQPGNLTLIGAGTLSMPATANLECRQSGDPASDGDMYRAKLLAYRVSHVTKVT